MSSIERLVLRSKSARWEATMVPEEIGRSFHGVSAVSDHEIIILGGYDLTNKRKPSNTQWLYETRSQTVRKAC